MGLSAASHEDAKDSAKASKRAWNIYRSSHASLVSKLYDSSTKDFQNADIA